MNIKLDRSEVCNLLRVITAIQTDQLTEAALTYSDEARKSFLTSAAGWEKLHDKIRTQLDAFDEKRGELK